MTAGRSFQEGMICTEARPLLTGLADDELDEARVAPLEAHLAGCPECRRALDLERATRILVASSLRGPTPAELPRRVAAGLAAARRAPGIARWLRVAAAVVAAAFLGLAYATAARAPQWPNAVEEAVARHRDVVAGRSGCVACCDVGEACRLLKVPVADLAQAGGSLVSVSPPGEAPCVVYQVVGRTVTYHAVSTGPMPESARRTALGKECFVFEQGGLSVLVCCGAEMGHVWVAEMPIEELVEVALFTPQGTPWPWSEPPRTFALAQSGCVAYESDLLARVCAVPGVRAWTSPKDGRLGVAAADPAALSRVERLLADAGVLSR